MAYSPALKTSPCVFATKSKKKCGYSPLSRKCEYTSLLSCDADMSKHLTGCHLPKSLQEYEVILARAGVFSWEKRSLQDMIICSSHRDEFGKYWRPPKSCQYPEHVGKGKKFRDRHVININLAAKIMETLHCVVPIGSRKFALFVVV